ncbi:hypothetical protein [Gordonia sp. (in: high G+C Gram-positive bacteria)]
MSRRRSHRSTPGPAVRRRIQPFHPGPVRPQTPLQRWLRDVGSSDLANEL